MIGDDLRQLLARVEAATGADRELDADITLSFQVPNEHYNRPFRRPVVLPPEHCRPGLLEYVEISGVSARTAPEYTASVDAALALVGRAAPEWTAWELRSRANRTWFTAILSQLGDDDQEACETAHAQTPALALLAALLRAKLAEIETETE